jgi:hypothetical protein
VLEKWGAQDSSRSGFPGPEFSTPIVFGGRAKDKYLFFSVLHRFNICVVCLLQGRPSQLEQMDVCCSSDGHRHVHRWISWDVVMIVGREEVAVLPVGEVGPRGARGK